MNLVITDQNQKETNTLKKKGWNIYRQNKIANFIYFFLAATYTNF